MAYLIPDDVLNTLKCSVCFKYLSVKPVKVYPNRQTKCGRCSEENDNGMVSLYETIIENSLFRCVNRYEGCNSVLTSEDMKLHEVGCIGGSYECCACLNFRGTAYEYLQHFTINHKNQILNKSVFPINLAEDIVTHYLYCKDDYIFIIYLKVEAQKDYLILDSIYIGPESNRKRLEVHFTITEGSNLLYTTEEKQCPSELEPKNGVLISVKDLRPTNLEFGVYCELVVNVLTTQSFLKLPINIDNENQKRITSLQGRMKSLRVRNKSLSEKLKSTECILSSVKRECSKRCLCKEYIECHINSIFISGEILIKHPEYTIAQCGYTLLCRGSKKFDLFCSNCEDFCQPFWNIYECEKCDAFLCNNCYPFVNKEHCVTGYKFKPNKPLSVVFNHIKIYCKWKCGEWFQIADLINHLKICDKRPNQFCPVVNCSWYGSLGHLEKHIENHTDIIFKISNFINDIIIDNSRKIIYLYTDKDVVVVIKKAKTLYNTYKCTILSVLSQLSAINYCVSLQLYPNHNLTLTNFNFNTNKIIRIVTREKVSPI